MIRALFLLLVLFILVACTAQETGTLTLSGTRPLPTVTATPEEEEIPPTPESQTALPEPTPIPTPTAMPIPVVIEDEPVIFEQLTSLEPLAINLDPAAGLIAYQKDNQLWLNKADLSGEPVSIKTCSEGNSSFSCVPQIHWSPDGTRFFYETPYDQPYQLIISDLQGRQQGIAVSERPYRSPVWSPEGDKIIFFIGTNRPWGDHDFDNGDPSRDFGFIDEVWQLEMDATGTWLSPQKLTDLETPGIGCGGGGRSYSDELYESQDGFSYGFQSARKMFWTPDDVIIYHLACDGTLSLGYGRYDVRANQQLEPYEGTLHGLVLDASGSRWYAITGHSHENLAENQLVTGTVMGTNYEHIETAVPVEMLFVGPQSGRLYYTSREQYDHKDLSGQIGWGASLPPSFHFYHTQLWALHPDGSSERLLWEADDHSYSRITEASDGDVLFVLIENDVALYEAMASGVPEEEWPEYLPHTYIMRLSLDDPQPEIWLEDTRDLNIWYPSGR